MSFSGLDFLVLNCVSPPLTTFIMPHCKTHVAHYHKQFINSIADGPDHRWSEQLN